MHDSRLEAQYCTRLYALKQDGNITEFKTQVTYDLRGQQGTVVGKHRVDFVVLFPDGRTEIREVKGFATEVWRLKRRLFEDNYPEIKYVVITAKEMR